MHASRPWEGCRRQWVVGRGAHRLKAPLSMLSSPVGEGEVSVQKACEKASTHTHTHAHTHMHTHTSTLSEREDEREGRF